MTQPTMLKVKEFFFPPLANLSDDSSLEFVLDSARDRIVTVLLRMTSVLGIPAVMVGSPELIQRSQWAPLILGNLGLLIFIYLSFRSDIPYRIRSVVFVVLAYAYVASTAFSAIDMDLLLNLFAFFAITTLLLGGRAGGVAFVLTLLTLLMVYYLRQNDLVTFCDCMFSAPPYVLAITWLFYCGVILFTLWIYIEGFYIAWQRESEAKGLLKGERDRLMDALEREKVLVEEVERSYQAENALARLQSEIITTVSHEFRTPLTVINTSTDTLRLYGDRLDDEKTGRIYSRIQQSIFYLDDLLTDVSAVNSVNSNGLTIQLQPMQFNEMCQSLKTSLLTKCHNPENLRFEFDSTDSTKVSIDYENLVQVALNLAHNALKYSDNTDMVEVEILLTNQLEINVADKGIGIPAASLPHIWDLFYRGENVETRRGLGLGLFLVKRIVTEMGGTVSAQSNGHQQGSKFGVKIPCKV